MLQQDIDPQETREWLEALDAVVDHDGPDRAQHLLERVVGHAQLTGAAPAPAGTTPYINTIPPQHEPEYPVDEELERRVRSLMRWNAIAMVLQANKESSELGGHIASYQSAAVLYEVGFNHFWRAPSDDHGGDLIYMQGHSSPGIYARAFLEGRLTEEQVRRLPPRGLAQRAAVVPASVADARLLAVPDGLDGAWPDHGHLPGPLHEVPRRPRGRRHRGSQGLGLPGRRRDRRARVAGRDLAGRARAARQPHLRHQLQPAAPGRSGARQRKDHPGARDGLPRLRAGTSSR